MRVFTLFAYFFCLCIASQQFQCSFRRREPSMPNGYINGVMKYDWGAKKLLNLYTTSGSRQMYAYNTQGGYGTAAKPFVEQFEFTWGPGCSCNSAALNEQMPILYTSTQYLTSSVQGGQTVYTPLDTANSPMLSVTFDAAGYPAVYKRTDGQTFTFSGCVDVSFPASDFNTPNDCSCGKPINVVLVLDRSSSIDKTEFGVEKQFTSDLVSSFTYSATGVNFGITNFHTLSWDGPVRLLEGNNEASVTAGASALQCAPDPQCVVFSSPGTCCGLGTSVSSGIVNGADMLATAVTSTGFRSKAANVMIVLTDGYHNKVLKKTGNVLERDGNGKPQGIPFQGTDGKTCSEAGESVCRAGLLQDLDFAVNYAVNLVPRLQIIAVGVGDVWDQEQLLHVANGIETNVFGTTEWSQLTSLVDDLVTTTCQSGDDILCTSCCGFCSCSGCAPVDGCDSGNFCDTTSQVGNCCNTVPKSPSVCNQPDQCFTYACDRNSNGGQGGCTSTVKPIKPSTMCEQYDCDPKDGSTVFTDLCPPQPICRVDVDCNDNKPCTVDTCVIPNPNDPLSAFCQATAVDCPRNKCATSACDTSTGNCVDTPIPIPAATVCNTFSCTLTDRIVSASTGRCTTTPLCTELNQMTDCDDSNACTDDTCVLDDPTEPRTAKCVWTPKPRDYCNKDDKCFSYTCVPSTGCVDTPIPIPAGVPCADYSCDPMMGILTHPTNICTTEPLCTVDNQMTNCDDGNACTDDTCVELVPGEPLSARCSWTPKPADYCEKGDKCFTYACVPASGCVDSPVPVPPNSTCVVNTCVPAVGVLSASSGACTDTPVCAVATQTHDCDDGNFCTDDTCVLDDPMEPKTAKCVFTPKDPALCEQADKCYKYSCNPLSGCFSEAKPIPTNVTCTGYVCNPDTGNITTIDLCPPQPKCLNDTDCDDLNACTTDMCVLANSTDPLSARCVWTPVPLAKCDDGNACTYDSCDVTLGCVNDPFADDFCNDRNECTTDSCDPRSLNLTDPCVHTAVVCDPSDICHNTTCYPDRGCETVDIVCPATDNCTISGCNTTQRKGCYVKSAGTCGFPVGLVAGLAAGVVAGIVIAAVAGALMMGAGAAYAYSQGAGVGLGATIEHNPLYEPEGTVGHNPLHRA